jgi:lipase
MVSPQPILKTADIGDSVIQYLLYDGSGQTIIFMHATGFLPWLWHPLARGLNDSYRIISPYVCDHREVDPEKGGFDWMLLAKDLTDFCGTLAIESPLMVGHSMGGAVMAIAAGHFGLDVEKMVLIEPIFLPETFYSIKLRVEDLPLAGKSIKRRNHWTDATEARAYLKSKPLFQSWDDEILDLYIRYGMVTSDAGGLELACHPRREAALFMGSMAYDPWPILPMVKCPVLVLEGEHTENKGFIEFKKAADTFPKGEYRLIHGAGHLIPMEKPQEVLSIIASFFSRG